MGKQDAFSQQSLVSSREFDFRDGESMSEMQTAVHVGEGEVSEPFRKLGLDFLPGEARNFLW